LDGQVVAVKLCPPIHNDVPLAPLTTLQVGGAARYFASAEDPSDVSELLHVAQGNEWPVLLLGRGSNTLVADAGYAGLVIQLDDRRIESLDTDGRVQVGAGVEWDDLVAWAVERDLAGLECLSGIPGRVGAAPVQNVGAYGQEVSECITHVHVVDRRTADVSVLTGDECGFSYRQSHFKGLWKDRFVITGVDFALRPQGPPTLKYGQLIEHFGADATPRLEAVRQGVLDIRRRKSMVVDLDDPNHRSVGSFFMNPVLPPPQADTLRERFAGQGVDVQSMPFYPNDQGSVKLSAAWLMERVGFARGHVHGAAGLSTNHVLALINRGSAQADDLVALARSVVRRVHDEVGVVLTPEPAFVGFDESVPTLMGMTEES
jgi:UDP-N-acetylmuramate dehydrogenase